MLADGGGEPRVEFRPVVRVDHPEQRVGIGQNRRWFEAEHHPDALTDILKPGQSVGPGGEPEDDAGHVGRKAGQLGGLLRQPGLRAFLLRDVLDHADDNAVGAVVFRDGTDVHNRPVRAAGDLKLHGVGFVSFDQVVQRLVQRRPELRSRDGLNIGNGVLAIVEAINAPRLR